VASEDTVRPRVRQLVVATYAAVAATPFLYGAATAPGFWNTIAPFVAALWFALVAAVVLARRWTWILATGIEVAVLLPSPFIETPWRSVALNVAALALLLSPPMRAHIARRRHTRASANPV
jgi:hypothetical protein